MTLTRRDFFKQTAGAGLLVAVGADAVNAAQKGEPWTALPTPATSQSKILQWVLSELTEAGPEPVLENWATVYMGSDEIFQPERWPRMYSFSPLDDRRREICGFGLFRGDDQVLFSPLFEGNRIITYPDTLVLTITEFQFG